MEIKKMNTPNIKGATLLTADEVKLLPRDIKRYDEWYWLRESKWSRDVIRARLGMNTAPCVHRAYGNNGTYVGQTSVETELAVRPALIISDLELTNMDIGDTFNFGGQEFLIISSELAFCKGDIGISKFRSSHDEDDASDYEASEVKKVVDTWFTSAK